MRAEKPATPTGCAQVVLFIVILIGLLCGSLSYNRSSSEGYIVPGGFLLPDGDSTTIKDVRVAGLPPWYEYQVHHLKSTGEHGFNSYSSIDRPKAVLNLAWCVMLSYILCRIAIRLWRKSDKAGNAPQP